MPIDIASGRVELDREDFSLPGRVPITWTRSYRTQLIDEPNGPLGPGWSTSWFPTLTRQGAEWRFTGRDATVNIFEDPANEVSSGGVVRLLGSFMEIFSRDGDVCITEWDVESGEIETFAFRYDHELKAYQLVSIENVSGDAVELERSLTGELNRLRQSIEQRTVLIKHTREGRIISLSLDGGDSGTPLIFYEYDSAGRLVAAVNRRGLAHRYEYDEHSRLKREMLPDGAVYTYKYDEQGRCIHFSGMDHYNEKKLRFIDPVSTTVLTDSYGVVKVFKANASGQIESEATPIGAKKETKFDDFGRVVEVVDELGAATVYSYDEFGNRDSITDALGNVTQFTFNDHHQPTSLVDANGQIWKREYNGEHRLSATVNPLGARWQIDYDSQGNPIEITEPMGFKRHQTFQRGMLRESTDFMENISRFKWDSFGRLIKRTGTIGEQTRFHYDNAGNLIRVDQPDGSSLRATYDAGDNLSSFTNANGHSIQYRYGTCQRLLERKDAIGRSVRYEWGTEPDRLEAVINEKGERFSYIRDDTGRIVLERSFDGREHSFAYSAAGRLEAFTNGNHERITYKRDPLGRLIEQTLPTSEKTIFEFDPVGRMTSAVNPHADVKFEYDLAGRLIKESQNEHWVQTEYNLAGEVIRTRTSLDHEVHYVLDPNGRVIKLTTAKDQSLEFDRDPRGLEIGRRMPGDMRLEQKFDVMGRMLEQRLGKSRYQASANSNIPAPARILPSTESIQRNYSYDPAGLLTALTDSHWGTTEYGYDPAERLLSALRDKGTSESFEFDATDNLTRAVQRNGSHTDNAFTYASGNSLQIQGNTAYEYDLDGRLIRKIERDASDAPQVWEYHWDAQGQMRGLRRPDNEEWKYKYDAFGRRIAKLGSGHTWHFVWKSNVILHEVYDNECVATWLFTSTSISAIAKLRKSFSSLISDHLGTPTELINTDGAIVWRKQLNAFGSTQTGEQATAQEEVPYRFAGQIRDHESELHYNRFRYYDSATARYLSDDPIGLRGGLNLSIYPRNPITKIDPFGLNGQNCTDDGNVLYHYTDEEGAKRIQETGVIATDAKGRVFLTTDKISPADANNALFMGRGGTKGTHRVEVHLNDPSGQRLRGDSQPNELVHEGPIRQGRNATLDIKENDF